MADSKNKKRVLIVEDNPASMRLAVFRLENSGYEVIQSINGESALETLKTELPDIILLDLRLPGIKGQDVFREIKKDNKFNNVKIIALTASVMPEDEEEIMEIGFDGFIKKPIGNKVQFINTVNDYLKKAG